MTWVKLDDSFIDHPKVIEAGPLAGWLFIASLCYSNRLLTDGFIPQRQIYRLIDVDDPQESADRLVEVGLWDVVDGGYQVHDYLEYQPSKKKITDDRRKARQRMDKARSQNVRANKGRTSEELPEKLERSSVNPVPSRPVPDPSQIKKSDKTGSDEPEGTPSGETPPNAHYELYVLCCELNGGDPKDNPDPSKQLRIFQRLLAKYGFDPTANAMRWMALDEFWQRRGFDAFNVENHVDRFLMMGQPDEPRATNNRTNDPIALARQIIVDGRKPDRAGRNAGGVHQRPALDDTRSNQPVGGALADGAHGGSGGNPG